MDQIRQGEIALKLIKHRIRKQGIQLSKSTMREFGNLAKEINVSIEELKQFTRPLLQELIDENFATK